MIWDMASPFASGASLENHKLDEEATKDGEQHDEVIARQVGEEKTEEEMVIKSVSPFRALTHEHRNVFHLAAI